MALAWVRPSLHLAYWQLCPHQTQLNVVCKHVGQLEMVEQSEVTFRALPIGKTDEDESLSKSTAVSVGAEEKKNDQKYLSIFHIPLWRD